jgi:GntR family transcriptional repressor for pyruvate dehydrogenase complex
MKALAGINTLERPNLGREIVDAISQLIVKGIWKPGDLIPSEKELAEHFGVGRSTIREAMQSMVIMGVVEIRRGEGTYICEPSSSSLSQAFVWGLLLGPRTIHEFTEFRICVEADCAEKAALFREPGAVDTLYDLLELIKVNQGNDARVMEYDNQFHITIAKSAGNGVFIKVVETIQSVVRLWFPITGPEPEMADKTLQEHRAIADAIAAQDGQAARAAMEHHLRTAGNRLGQLLDDNGSKH